MYQKMISYIYEYIDGKKGKNIGFVKMAVQNQNYKIRVQMNQSVMTGKEISVYGFVRDQGMLHSTCLGIINPVNGMVTGMFSGNCGELWDRYRFMDMNGLILCSDEEIKDDVQEEKIPVFFASQWDDEPIIFEAFDIYVKMKKQKIEKQEEKVLHVAEIEVKPSFCFEENREENAAVIQSLGLAETEEIRSGENMEDRERSECSSSGENLENGIRLSSGASHHFGKYIKVGKPIFNIRRKNEPKKSISNENVCRDLETQEENNVFLSSESKKEFHNSEEDCIHSRNEDADTDVWDLFEKRRVKMKEQYDQLVTAQKKREKENIWQPGELMFENFPVLNPFFQDDVLEAVRLEPKDIGGLPMEYWYLANNSFLLHGYYNYRHLLFLKLRNRQEYQYAIAVPGSDTNRERFMANMFGFEHFKPVKKKDTFGYWWKRLV